MEPTGTNGRTAAHSFRPLVVGRVCVFPVVVCLVGWQGTLFLDGHDDDANGKAFDSLASVSPVPGPPRSVTSWSDSVAGRFRLWVGRLEWFCGGHGPGETPGPIPNPEAKAWHGDGTALERVWESSAPPHSTVWTFWSSPLRDSRKVPFLFAQGVFLRPVGDYGRRQAGLREDSSSGWRFSDCGRPVGVLVIPVSG